MKKKNEVYVVVDTPKKAKKLKKVLDMFFETHTGSAIGSDYYDGVKLFNDTWCAIRTKREVKYETEVSIKELRNILAREYLKDGDFVVIKSIYNDDWVMEVDTVEDYKAYHKLAINKSSGYKVNKGFLELNFIRYATEEERQLLCGKKELQEGKWYKYPGYPKFLSIHTTDGNRYGFDIDGVWFENAPMLSSGGGYIEATPEEVEQALIEEAKRRGFGFGVTINHGHLSINYRKEDLYILLHRSFEFNEKYNSLWLGGVVIFKDGQWATIIEQDKFAELKEAHRNGKVIQYYNVCLEKWFDDESPDFNDNHHYRIKPQTTFTDKDVAIIERLHDTLLDNHKYDLQSDILIDARMLADKIKSNIK